MGNRAYVAIDLGAESGRVIVGTLARDRAAGQQKLELHEVHRFTHEPIRLQGGLYWNVPHIWKEILGGLSEAAAHAKKHDLQVVSVGVDTWGVDYVLLDARGQPLAPPRCYRDARRELGAPLVQEKIGYERLYQVTGIQEMTFNTVVQLAGAIASGESFANVDRLLMMPDYFHFLLGGEPRNEVSIASTSQMLDASTGNWSAELISKLGLPQRLFQTPCPPGTALGRLKTEVCATTGLAAEIRIIAPGSHDTASAVAAVPTTGDSWAYLSSGTWSLLGVELSAPILTEQARRAGFTNERGVGNTIRFLKNVVGLWLLQELRRDLERQGTKLDYAQLTEAAAAAEPFRTSIDASHSSFITPGGAIEKIKSLAKSCGEHEPRTPGELARCCLEALAIAYRGCLESLETLTKHVRPRIDTIHIVGGGTKNTLLNQMAADATGRRALVGPTEATAAGSVLVQVMADGQTKDLASIRAIVARSFDTVEYLPRDTALWNQQYARHRAKMETRT